MNHWRQHGHFPFMLYAFSIYGQGLTPKVQHRIEHWSPAPVYICCVCIVHGKNPMSWPVVHCALPANIFGGFFTHFYLSPPQFLGVFMPFGCRHSAPQKMDFCRRSDHWITGLFLCRCVCQKLIRNSSSVWCYTCLKWCHHRKSSVTRIQPEEAAQQDHPTSARLIEGLRHGVPR